MNILDTHHHLWDLSLRSYDWITELPENESIKINRNFLINDLDVIANKNNVTGTICVQAHQSEEEALWLLEIAKNSNLIKGVVCWVDLKNSNIGFSLDKYQTYDKFCGIRHVWHDEKPKIKENIFEPWAENISELSKIDSLNCKISGMVEEMNDSQEISILKNYTDHVIESFGHDKVMYGSNWPVCLTKKSYSEVLEIAKSISNNLDPEKFFYTNGKSFYLD